MNVVPGLFLFLCLLGLPLTANAQCDDFVLGFEVENLTPGQVLSGSPGDVFQFRAEATIRTCGAGVKGWALGFGGKGCEFEFDRDSVEACTLDCTGATVGHRVIFNSPTLVDPNRVPNRGPLEGIVQGPGVVDAVLLALAEELDEGTTRIMTFEFRVTVPRRPEEVRLFYLDGLQGLGTPVTNGLSFDRVGGPPFEAIAPALGEFAFGVTPVGDDGLMLPGDCNGDQLSDITDAICLLSYIFIGVPKRLPCDDGFPTDSGNVDLLDWTGGGVVDFTDAIAQLTYLLLGGPPHSLGAGCAAISFCPVTCGF